MWNDESYKTHCYAMSPGEFWPNNDVFSVWFGISVQQPWSFVLGASWFFFLFVYIQGALNSSLYFLVFIFLSLFHAFMCIVCFNSFNIEDNVRFKRGGILSLISIRLLVLCLNIVFFIFLSLRMPFNDFVKRWSCYWDLFDIILWLNRIRMWHVMCSGYGLANMV